MIAIAKKIEIPIISIVIENEGTRNLTQDLKIDPINLTDDFSSQPALFAYYASLQAKAKAQVDKCKLAIEIQKENLEKVVTSRLDAEARFHLSSRGERITESKVNAYIYAHETYKKEQDTYFLLKNKYIEAMAKLATFDNAVEALKQRKDMLISVGAQIRAEGGNTELYMKEKAFNIVNN